MGNPSRYRALLFFLAFGLGVGPSPAQTKPKKPRPVDTVLQETKPLEFARGKRLPLYVWSARLPERAEDAELERLLKELDARGIGTFTRWQAKHKEVNVHAAMRLARLQQKLGLPVVIDATRPTYGFFNGDPETAHIDDDGKPFFDMSFERAKIGCPFAARKNLDMIRDRLELFLLMYKARGLPMDFWAADWEIDGPMEWNEAWAHAKRCRRCRENLPDIDKFESFQSAVRKIRSELQNEAFSQPVKKHFPNAMVGNYGVNPHDGHRYWWDYFEKPTEGLPARREQNALYRPWYNEFEPSGYNVAMPVIYAWYRIYDDYEFAVKEYRWFYNMLREGSSVAKGRKGGTPIVAFVHFTPIAPPKELPADFQPLSDGMYRELLWHLLLRGIDAFCLWTPSRDLVREIRPLHQVYAAAFEYREFLEAGQPVNLTVPQTPGTVISGLRLGQRVLVRRTDLVPAKDPVALTVDGQQVSIPVVAGRCQLLQLPD